MEVAKKTDFSIASIMRESPNKKRKLSPSPDGQAIVYSHHGWIVPGMPSQVPTERSQLPTTPDGPLLFTIPSPTDSVFVSPTTTSGPHPVHSTPKPSQKRKRSSSPHSEERSLEVNRTPSPFVTSPVDTDRSGQTPSPTPSNGSDQSVTSEDGDSQRKRKKARTAFTADQLTHLECRFRSQRYLAANERNFLARQLGLKDQQVKTWFQNRRMKDKRQVKELESRLGHTVSLPHMPATTPLSVVTQPIGASPLPTYNLAASTLLATRDQILNNSLLVPPPGVSLFTDSAHRHQSPLYLDDFPQSRLFGNSDASKPSLHGQTSVLRPGPRYTASHLLY